MPLRRALLGARYRAPREDADPCARLAGRRAAACRAVYDKLRTGAYAWESRPCFCGADQDLLLAEVDRYGLPYPFVLCAACGLLRAQPRLTEAAYADFYAHHYRDLYGEGDLDEDELFDRRLTQGRDRYAQMRERLDLAAGAVVAEIGCDFGATLAPYAEAGCRVHGCDHGAAHLGAGRTRLGLSTLHQGGPEVLEAAGVRADLVLLYHVFEHFTDLDGALASVRRLLKPTGRCYVEVPGCFARVHADWRRSAGALGYLQNAHTHAFTLESLTYVFGCGGLDRVHGTQAVEALFAPAPAPRPREARPRGLARRVLGHLRTSERRWRVKAALKRLLGR